MTRDLPGRSIIGVDVSEEAIRFANESATDRVQYRCGDLFGLKSLGDQGRFDLIIITGVLYPQYIGNAHNLVYYMIDQLLTIGGVLVSVHVNEWYAARFPYILLKERCYGYRQYQHRFEVYIKWY